MWAGDGLEDGLIAGFKVRIKVRFLHKRSVAACQVWQAALTNPDHFSKLTWSVTIVSL